MDQNFGTTDDIVNTNYIDATNKYKLHGFVSTELKKNGYHCIFIMHN